MTNNLSLFLNKFSQRVTLVFLLFFTTLGNAQQNDVRAYPMEETGLLWQIEGPNVVDDCYLFGTMHLLPAEAFFFPKKLKKTLSKSDQLVMEVPSSDLDPALAEELMLMENGSLSDFLTGLQMDTLKAWAKDELGISEELFGYAFESLKPIAVVQMATHTSSAPNAASYELTLEEIAIDIGLIISGLESFQEQLSLFDSLDTSVQANMIMESIREEPNEELNEKILVDLYMSQDIDALYQSMTEEEGLDMRMQEVLLDNRNIKWIPQIKNLIGLSKTFIAVGAGHLGGPKGLIRLLEAEGYTLTPIKL